MLLSTSICIIAWEISMSDWSMGYRTDVLYTYGYYRELNPLFVKTLLLSQGYACPDFGKGAMACELGFGQGVSINMHALSSQVSWYGTDFNPSQVNFARTIAHMGDNPVLLADDDFASFAQRTDLPDFDLIALHGIWSWISPENQDVIIDFVRRKLKIGGVLYISYNVSPGFMLMEPVRHLMKEFDQELVAPNADVNERLSAITNFITAVLGTNPDTIKAVPIMRDRIAGILGNGNNAEGKGAGSKDSHYLIGEYLNTYWDISHFSVLAERFDRAKVSFACSASPKDLLDSINLSAADQQLLAPLKGKNIYETTRDFIVNRQFRRDYFIKGPMLLSPAQRDAALDELSFILMTPASEVKYTIESRLGEAHLVESIYRPIIELMSDLKVRSFAQMLQELKTSRQTLLEAILTLSNNGTLSPAVPLEQVAPEVVARCHKFNHTLLEQAQIAQMKFLASPVLQGAFSLSDIFRVLLQLYLKNEHSTKEELSAQLCTLVLADGKTLNKDGKPITKRKEQEEILNEQVELFLGHTLPLIKAIGAL